MITWTQALEPSTTLHVALQDQQTSRYVQLNQRQLLVWLHEGILRHDETCRQNDHCGELEDVNHVAMHVVI